MRHRATPDFWYYYRLLPPNVQGLADQCYELLKLDPRYPSLHFKKVGQFWSVRVGLHYRALCRKSMMAILLGFGSDRTQNTTNYWVNGLTPRKYSKLL